MLDNIRVVENAELEDFFRMVIGHYMVEEYDFDLISWEPGEAMLRYWWTDAELDRAKYMRFDAIKFNQERVMVRNVYTGLVAEVSSDLATLYVLYIYCSMAPELTKSLLELQEFLTSSIFNISKRDGVRDFWINFID